MKHKKTAALTGGVASGKSTVSRMFQELGAHVIDADIVARQVVEPEQPAWQEIVAHFGQDILLDDGHIHRAKLGKIVFTQPEERQLLERIIHPRVIQEINRQEQLIRATDNDRVILADVPLLIEASMHTEYSTVIVVYVSADIQLKRLMIRDRISEQDARQKIVSQMPLSEKLTYGTHIIDNSESLEQTQQQVKTIYQQLMY